MKHVFVIIFSFLLFACNNQPGKKQETNLKTMGTIERMDASLDNIISAGAQPEIIADGFEWSEGPLWIEQHNMLLFSDVPTNTVYKWTEEKRKRNLPQSFRLYRFRKTWWRDGIKWFDIGYKRQSCFMSAWQQANGKNGCVIESTCC